MKKLVVMMSMIVAFTFFSGCHDPSPSTPLESDNGSGEGAESENANIGDKPSEIGEGGGVASGAEDETAPPEDENGNVEAGAGADVSLDNQTPFDPYTLKPETAGVVWVASGGVAVTAPINAGTFGNPFGRLNEAISFAKTEIGAGKTVKLIAVKAGTYSEPTIVVDLPDITHGIIGGYHFQEGGNTTLVSLEPADQESCNHQTMSCFSSVSDNSTIFLLHQGIIRHVWAEMSGHPPAGKATLVEVTGSATFADNILHYDLKNDNEAVGISVSSTDDATPQTGPISLSHNVIRGSSHSNTTGIVINQSTAPVEISNNLISLKGLNVIGISAGSVTKILMEQNRVMIEMRPSLLGVDQQTAYGATLTSVTNGFIQHNQMALLGKANEKVTSLMECVYTKKVGTVVVATNGCYISGIVTNMRAVALNATVDASVLHNVIRLVGDAKTEIVPFLKFDTDFFSNNLISVVTANPNYDISGEQKQVDPNQKNLYSIVKEGKNVGNLHVSVEFEAQTLSIDSDAAAHLGIYQLKSGSQSGVIDAAVGLMKTFPHEIDFSKDLTGHDRPKGIQSDVGAIEYQ